MKANGMRLMAVAGLMSLAQPVVSRAANVLVDFSASFNDQTLPPFPFTDNNDPAAVTQATGPLNGSLTHYATSSTATANFGSLLVNTTASGVSDEALSTNSKAGWVDSLTILGSGSGTLKLYFTLSGTLAAVGGGGGSVAVTTYNVTGDVNGSIFARTGAVHSSAGPLSDPLTDFNVTTGTFTFGTPFKFDVSLLGAASYSGNNIAAGSGSSTASNLQLTLTGIEVYDQFNAPVTSPGITSGCRHRLWHAGAFAGGAAPDRSGRAVLPSP